MKTITYIILSILIFSCTKKSTDGHMGPSCDNPQNYNLTSADLLNTRFKTGTYWVYLDSVTLTVDSEYVINHVQSIYTQPENCDTYEIFQYNTKVYPSLKENGYLINYSGINKNPKDVREGIRIYTDYIQAKTFPSYYTTYDSLYVYDRYYKKVEKITCTADYTFSNDPTTYYMNSEFGILKIVTTYSSVLTAKKLLIRKNIVK